MLVHLENWALFFVKNCAENPQTIRGYCPSKLVLISDIPIACNRPQFQIERKSGFS